MIYWPLLLLLSFKFKQTHVRESEREVSTTKQQKMYVKNNRRIAWDLIHFHLRVPFFHNIIHYIILCAPQDPRYIISLTFFFCSIKPMPKRPPYKITPTLNLDRTRASTQCRTNHNITHSPSLSSSYDQNEQRDQSRAEKHNM